MVMPAARAEWTVEMLDALPDDGQRYELIDGELFVTPAPAEVHQLIVGELYVRLRAYLRPSAVGRAMISPSDVRRGDVSRNRLQPDVFVLRLIGDKRPSYPYSFSDLLLAIEVESPGNARYDYQVKRRVYLSGGVPEFWVVSPGARTIARWRGHTDIGELLTDELVWHPDGMDMPFTISIPEFFDEAER